MTVDVLVVGTSIDPHISAVLTRLPPAVSVVRFDVDLFPRLNQLSIQYANDGLQVCLEQGGQEFDISRPRVAWFRRLGKVGISDKIPDKYRQFCIGEAEQALEGMLSLIQPGVWVNEYWATRRAANKPFQYSVARAVGLAAPDTLVTNSPDRAEQWLSAAPLAAVKSIHSPVVIHGESLGERAFAFTHQLTAEDRQNLAEVATTACQFQPYLHKAYELRVTTIGGHHFAVRIDAPELTGRDDWRPAAKECIYQSWELPYEVAAGLTRLMDALGLGYAASDFIVTPTGETIFLESNPHGAWLWLEENLPGLGIADHFGRYVERVVNDSPNEAGNVILST